MPMLVPNPSFSLKQRLTMTLSMTVKFTFHPLEYDVGWEELTIKCVNGPRLVSNSKF